jgi:hypothetical protein
MTVSYSTTEEPGYVLLVIPGIYLSVVLFASLSGVILRAKHRPGPVLRADQGPGSGPRRAGWCSAC